MNTNFKRRQKLTRRSYNRRLVLFGAMILVAIALISTGFASWVISLGSTQNESGDINVGVVADRTIKLTDLEGKIGDEANFILLVSGTTETEQKISVNFHFEPEKTDTDGVFSNDGTVYENMKITVTGKLYNLDIVEGFAIKMEIPASVQAAADAGYIILPECVSENGYVVGSNEVNGTGNTSNITFRKETETVQDVTVEYAVFSYDIVFEWGDAFKLTENDVPEGVDISGVAHYEVVRVGDKDVNVAKNPWIYYEEVMNEITSYEDQVAFAETAKTKINEFRKTIYNLTDETVDTAYDNIASENKTFKITIIASTAALVSEETPAA